MARASNLNEDGQASGNEDVSIPDEALLTTSDSEDSESYGERASEARAYAEAQAPEDDGSDLFAQLVAEGESLGEGDSTTDSAVTSTSSNSADASVASVSGNDESDSTDGTSDSEEDVVTEDGATDTSDLTTDEVVSEDLTTDESVVEEDVVVEEVVVEDDSVIAEDSGDWTDLASSDDFVDYSDSDPAAE
ncbi:MAG: hypothetical protein EBU43_06160 [Actinobacteria bacterium]|nr:hypothetical protein [Actinomycetota bacterium]